MLSCLMEYTIFIMYLGRKRKKVWEEEKKEGKKGLYGKRREEQQKGRKRGGKEGKEGKEKRRKPSAGFVPGSFLFLNCAIITWLWLFLNFVAWEN